MIHETRELFGVMTRYTGPDNDNSWKLIIREEKPWQVWLSQFWEEAEAYAEEIKIEGTETKVVTFDVTLTEKAEASNAD